jgi:hypothetical protein
MKITLPNWPISRGFAQHPQTGCPGIDFSIINGTPLPAGFSGTIETIGTNPTGQDWGNYCWLRSDEPAYKIAYAHCQRFIVNQGQKVSQGQIIGYSDNTGNSTGSHLHFSLNFNGKCIDPAPYLKGGEDMVNKDLLNAFFIDLLERSPDPGAVSTYQDRPDWSAIQVYHAIRTSPERAALVAKKQSELDVLKTQLTNIDNEVVALRVEVKNNNELLKSQGGVIDRQEEELENQRKNILDQEKEIEVLNQRIKELATQQGNDSPSPLQSLLDRIITWFKERR